MCQGQGPYLEDIVKHGCRYCYTFFVQFLHLDSFFSSLKVMLIKVQVGRLCCWRGSTGKWHVDVLGAWRKQQWTMVTRLLQFFQVAANTLFLLFLGIIFCLIMTGFQRMLLLQWFPVNVFIVAEYSKVLFIESFAIFFILYTRKIMRKNIYFLWM